MGKGEERGRKERRRKEGDELCKNEQSLANNVLTHPLLPLQCRCLMGLFSVCFVQDPWKFACPMFLWWRQAGWSDWLFWFCCPFCHCPSSQAHSFSSIPAPAHFLTCHIAITFSAPMRPTGPLSYQMMKEYLVHGICPIECPVTNSLRWDPVRPQLQRSLNRKHLSASVLGHDHQVLELH